jgi:drug/metabolite transporter (DMT)-like permease
VLQQGEPDFSPAENAGAENRALAPAAREVPGTRLWKNFLEIILGISAAFGWGVADFSARFAARRVGTFRTLMGTQLIGLIALSIFLWLTGGFSRSFAPGWSPWIFAIVAGMINTFSALCLYRSFEVGLISIAGPVSSSYPALTVALAFLSGERIHAIRAVGLALTFFGMILAAITFAPDEQHAVDPQTHHAHAHVSKGAALAIVAAIGYGVLFWWLGFHVVPLVGGAVSVWVIRATTLSLVLLVGVPTGQTLPLPRGNVWWLLLATGLTDTTAFVANNIGLGSGHVAVLSVLSSLYGAVTVLLSWIFLRERIDRSQWFGIFVIFAGIVLVSI